MRAECAIMASWQRDAIVARRIAFDEMVGDAMPLPIRNTGDGVAPGAQPPHLAQPAILPSLFAQPDYRRLWAIGGLSGIARWLEFLSLSVFAYEVTQSPQLVALLAIVRMLPYVLFGIATGALADMFDRRVLLLAGIGLVLATSAVMTVLAVLGLAGYWTVVAATLVSGFFWVTDMPVRRRLLVDLAGPARVPAALGYDNATSYATRALGPVIGGAVYQALGIQGIFALSTLIYAWSLFLAYRLSAPKPAAGEPPSQKIPGLGFLLPPKELLRSRPFLIILGITLVYNLWCFPFVTMVPVLAQKDFALSPVAVGLLSACDGVGGTLGAILVGRMAKERTFFRFYFFGTVSFLVLLALLSLHLTVPAAAIGLFLIGGAAACFSASQYALVYLVSPPHLRGRAAGFLSIFIGSAVFGFWNAGALFAAFPSDTAMALMAAEGLVPLLILGWLWWRA
jgi:MFS family permease